MFTHLLDHVKKSLNPLNIVEIDPDTEEIKRYLDDQDRRHYQDDESDVYSVTTVIDELEGESEGLKWWRRNNNGKGDNPNWKHLLEYKKNRGTLAHHAAMADQYEALNDGEELWSGDETESLNEVMDRTGDDRFLYSILADKGWVSSRDQYEETIQDEDVFEIDDVLAQDLEYFTNEYENICESRGINEDSLQHIEEMFVVPPNHEHDGYGGQVDIIYEDPATGDTVVADLKTSSAVRDKHKYQAAAYAKAVEKTGMYDEVDRAEIIRIHPDSEESEVHQFKDFGQYWDEFADTTYEM